MAASIGFVFWPVESFARPLPRSNFDFLPAWNGSVMPSFPGAKSVKQMDFDASIADEFFSNLMDKRELVVVKKSPVFLWPALQKWQILKEFAQSLGGKLKVHLPSHPLVRIHHNDMPFQYSANWTRPFVEGFVSPSDLLSGSNLVYAMFHNMNQIPKQLQKEIDIRWFTIPWRLVRLRYVYFVCFTVLLLVEERLKLTCGLVELPEFRRLCTTTWFIMSMCSSSVSSDLCFFFRMIISMSIHSAHCTRVFG